MTIIGINQNYQVLNDVKVKEGRCLTEIESEYRLTNCVIGSGIVTNLFGNKSVGVGIDNQMVVLL